MQTGTAGQTGSGRATPAAIARIARLLGDEGPIGRSTASIVLVLAWALTWRPQVDPDLWWHLRIGAQVLTTHDVPRVDGFSWWTAGQPFVAHSWLWDAIVRATYDAAGLTGTSLLATGLSALVIGLLWILLRAAAPAVPPLGRAVAVAVAIAAGLPIWAPRAQLWDLVLILACVAIWTTYLRGGRVALLALVPGLAILWANLHGSGVLGLPACLLALAVAVPVGVRWGTWPRRPVLPLIVSSVVALGALAINPYGVSIPLYPFDAAVASAFQPAIDEWRSPDFSDVGLLTMRVLLAGGIVGAIGLRGRSRDPLLLLVAAGWTFVALGSVRFVLIAGPMLVLALAPGVAAALRAWLAEGEGIEDGGDPGDPRLATGGPASIPDRPTPAAVPWIGAAVVIAVLLLTAWIQVAPDRQASEIAQRYPVAAADRLVAASCVDRILNAYDWGGYLSFRTGRSVGAYGNSPGDVVTAEAGLEQLSSDPGSFLDAHGIDIVLMKTGSPIDRWLDLAPGWAPAGQDSLASFHVRAGSTTCLG